MAKRKTPKVKKPSKITNEHLSKLQETVSKINRAQLDLGILETRKHNLLHGVASIQDELTLMQSKFEKEYGTTDIDIQTGEINYNKNEQTDQKN
tara:strand:+ start:25 stop:306 length:282 start_codon:yes stop_codon:yes gene_type:complete